MNKKLVMLLVLFAIALLPAAAAAYVLVDGASPDRGAETPATQRSELEMEDLTFDILQRDFASGRAPTLDDLKVGKDWTCFLIKSSESTDYSQQAYTHWPNVFTPHPYRHEDKEIVGLKVAEADSGAWPSLLRYSESDHSYSHPLQLSADSSASASWSYRSPGYCNQWRASASVALRADAEGRGLLLHYSGDYQYECHEGSDQYGNDRLLSHSTRQGYAACRWTLRR